MLTLMNEVHTHSSTVKGALSEVSIKEYRKIFYYGFHLYYEKHTHAPDYLYEQYIWDSTRTEEQQTDDVFMNFAHQLVAALDRLGFLLTAGGFAVTKWKEKSSVVVTVQKENESKIFTLINVYNAFRKSLLTTGKVSLPEIGKHVDLSGTTDIAILEGGVPLDDKSTIEFITPRLIAVIELKVPIFSEDFQELEERQQVKLLPLLL